MDHRRFWIIILTGLNLALLAAMVLSRPWLPSAMAQGSGGRGGFVSVSAKVAGQNYDMLYILDVAERKLHGFFPGNVQTRELTYAGNRDLKADFD